MAQLSIRFVDTDGRLIDSICVIGRKQTKAQMINMYGKNADNINDDYYFVKKPNKYGIHWVMLTKDTRYYGGGVWNICSYGQNTVPVPNGRIFVTKF